MSYGITEQRSPDIRSVRKKGRTAHIELTFSPVRVTPWRVNEGIADLEEAWNRVLTVRWKIGPTTKYWSNTAL
jgi:hypothetical protein